MQGKEVGNGSNKELLQKLPLLIGVSSMEEGGALAPCPCTKIGQDPRRNTRETEEPVAGEPPVGYSDLGAGRGWQRGGETDAGYIGRLRHLAQGAETSGRGLQVVGMGDI